ncbi:unnamed protein product [Calypogeia fissa]
MNSRFDTLLRIGLEFGWSRNWLWASRLSKGANVRLKESSLGIRGRAWMKESSFRTAFVDAFHNILQPIPTVEKEINLR